MSIGGLGGNTIGTEPGSTNAGVPTQGFQTLESLKEVFTLHLGALDFLVLALAIATAVFAKWTTRFLTAPKAVMRSQNRARERSRLHHATLASNSPPPPPSNDVSPQESAPATSPKAAPSSTASARSAATKQTSPTYHAPPPHHSSQQAISPAYPFPPMRSMSSASIGASFNSPGAGPLDKLLPSGTPTPATVAFHPLGSQPASTCENPEFPSPNMYELTLLLHSEPGVEAFWSNVVNIATTCYKAERVTLAVPSDSTDLENTPWGQKATFNVADDDRFSLTYMGNDQHRVGDPDGGEYSEEEDGSQGVAIPKEEEPPPNICVDKDSGQMELRNEMNEETDPVPIDTSPDPPFGPVTVGIHDIQADAASNSDWISVTSGLSPGEDVPEPPTVLSEMDIQEGREQAERAFKGGDGPTRGTVFPMLQPLNYEADALLDETGVSRVLQRGKTVVLSREYRDIKTHLEEKEKRRKDVQSAKTTSPAKSKPTIGPGKLDLPTSPFAVPSQFLAGKGRRRRKKMQLPKDSYPHNPVSQYYSTQQHLHHVKSRSNSPTRYSSYEEYEQPISSPWSQSPAPSPAPRPDPSENPFFTIQPKVDEETFNPAAQSPVYSAQEPVNAIGCESSWTVIHIPLVHPSQSRGPNQSAASAMDSAFSSPKRQMLGSTVTALEDIGKQSKKPIAILSMLSPVIPYPSNLIHSLSHFAPLVATAYSLASSHTNVLNQLNSLRKMRAARRPQMPRQVSYMTDLRSQETLLGSVTSPSESSSAPTISNVTSPWEGPGGISETPGGVPLPLHGYGSDKGYKSGGSTNATPMSPLSGGGGDSYFSRARVPPIFSRQTSGIVPTVVPKGADPELYTSLATVLKTASGKASNAPKDNSQSTENNPPANDHPLPMPHKDVLIADENDVTPTQASEDKGKEPSSSRPPMPEEHKKSYKRGVKAKKLGSRHRHQYLHSYGADLASSFQCLPALSPSSAPKRRRSKGAHINIHEMPPPSNRLLRTITDSIPVHVFTAIPDTGQITWVNARMLAYRGITAEQFLKGPWDSLHPEDRDEYLRHWGIAVRKGEPFSHQMRVRRFDGDYRWFMVRAVPLRDPRGIIVHWFGTNMDIHDQRLAEVNAARQAEMAESEMKYRSLANSSPQIVFAATASHGITFANTQWLSYSGQTLEQALRLGFMEHVHPTDRHKCCLPSSDGSYLGMFDAASYESTGEARSPSGYEWSGDRKGKGKVEYDDNDKPTHSTEIRLKDKHGNYRWHLVRCVSVDSKVDDKDGLWFGTCTDINDHKLLEQKLKEANEAAQRTMDSKTRFLANMSHEIRKLHPFGIAV
jgi:PAS domain S-box-containing protein